MDLTKVVISLLYFFGGLLPIIGLYRLLKEVREPAKKHSHREGHIRALREKRGRLLAGTEPHHSRYTEPEVEEWHARELAKEDQWGRRYNDSDAYLNFSSHTANSFGTYKQLKQDFLFIGGGVLCATVASIWSVW